MCWEWAGVVSETKPLPGHAISARAGLSQMFGSARQPAKKKEEEKKQEQGRQRARWDGVLPG